MSQLSYNQNQYPQYGYWDIAVHISPMRLEDEDDAETAWIEELKRRRDAAEQKELEKAQAEKHEARQNEAPSQ